ncbi:FAD-dependent oxidoreductase [Mollicutes bacterium LVI A0078]|nr:FAD-dependent oxidoreductase [Mollicutes bacterium LVI A0075]WOO90679.1 FAD-dependent oxidoreductase [Mollicutes bacterium LVI A0078]
MKVLVIGGVAGGASSAARIRRLDENAEIIMFDKGPFVSFSNCGLPYHMSGAIASSEKLILMSPEKFASQYNIEARVSSEVTNVDSTNKTVSVINHATGETYIESYDKLVVSPGAEAFVPNFSGLDLIPNYTLKTVTDVQKIMAEITENEAEHITVIGAGFIGVEAAENLIEAGKKVTLVEGSDQVLQPLDKDMANLVHLELLKHNVDLRLNTLVEDFAERKVLLKGGDSIETDLVILAIGVKPDTKFLESSGIEMTDRGHIVVNEEYQTSCKDIWAAGDAILVNHSLSGDNAPLALAGPANKQGRLIADSMYGKKVLNKGYIGSSIIKVFDLTAASTGLNEKQAKAAGINYNVAYAAPMDKVGIMPGAAVMPTKILFDENGKLLGGQIVATGAADKRVDVLATAIKAEMDVYDLADLELCYAPPFGTGKDVINKLGYVAMNLLEGIYKQVRFSEVYDLLENDAQVIDVRETGEYARGHIDGVINIPMSEMRNRLDELDKSKPVYVHCQTGQRSYNMTLMLMEHGFEALNVAGSYLFISKYEQAMQAFDENRKNILV